MLVKSIAEWEHSAILSTFIKLPFIIKIFVLSIFEWPFYTGFTVIKILNICDLTDKPFAFKEAEIMEFYPLWVK